MICLIDVFLEIDHQLRNSVLLDWFILLYFEVHLSLLCSQFFVLILVDNLEVLDILEFDIKNLNRGCFYN
jgi:hypothetical protein